MRSKIAAAKKKRLGTYGRPFRTACSSPAPAPPCALPLSPLGALVSLGLQPCSILSHAQSAHFVPVLDPSPFRPCLAPLVPSIASARPRPECSGSQTILSTSRHHSAGFTPAGIVSIALWFSSSHPFTWHFLPVLLVNFHPIPSSPPELLVPSISLSFC